MDRGGNNVTRQHQLLARTGFGPAGEDSAQTERQNNTCPNPATDADQRRSVYDRQPAISLSHQLMTSPPQFP